MSYKQLIEGQRYQSQAYLREGLSCPEARKRLWAGYSTISRAVTRYLVRDNHYLPEIARAKTLKQHFRAVKIKSLH